MIENTDESMPESLRDQGHLRPKKMSRNVVASIVVGILAVAGAAALVSLVTQPTAITRAGDACSGVKPLNTFFDNFRETASPQPKSEPTEARESAVLDDLFNGVVSVADNGTTLVINTASKDDDPLGMTSLAMDCVYEQLDVPSHIRQRVGATRAMDGRQDGTWAGYTASWSYHPDSGANVIIVQD